MAQRTSGVFRILSASWAYRLFQSLVGADRARTIFVREHLKPVAGSRILDIGCGTGEILDYLPAVDYVGIDLSSAYIQSAKARYGDRGEFRACSAEQLENEHAGKFDLVMAIGVLHHLDDRVVEQLFKTVYSLLNVGGRLVTLDPVFDDRQSAIARYIIRSDRGQNVRTESALHQLAETRFSQVKSQVRSDMVRIPYTHVILECVR